MGLSVLISALMPLPDGHMLQDPETGNLSVTWAIIIFGCIVVLYTMAGGLWGVLMTDVIQFLILTLFGHLCRASDAYRGRRFSVLR